MPSFRICRLWNTILNNQSQWQTKWKTFSTANVCIQFQFNSIEVFAFVCSRLGSLNIWVCVCICECQSVRCWCMRVWEQTQTPVNTGHPWFYGLGDYFNRCYQWMCLPEWAFSFKKPNFLFWFIGQQPI